MVRKEKSMQSKVQSEFEFHRSYPDHKFNSRKSGCLPVPNSLSVLDVNQLIRSLAPSMVACTSAMRMNSEASRYPFVLEVLKHFARLSGELHLSIDKKIESNFLDEDVARLAIEFEETMDTDDQYSESPWELIVNWEDFCKDNGGPNQSGFGFLQFSAERSADASVRCLVHCKQSLELGSDVRLARGLWQLAAEMVTAQEENVRCAGEAACMVAVKEFNADRAAQVGETDRAEDDFLAKTAGEEARRSAEAAMREEPVWGVLTDFRDWIFLRVVGGTLQASNPVHMFKIDNRELSCGYGIADGLQFLHACFGIDTFAHSVAGKLKMIQEENACREESFVASIPGSVQLDTPAMRKCAARCFKRIVELGKSEAEAKEVLSEIFLDVYIDNLVLE